MKRSKLEVPDQMEVRDMLGTQNPPISDYVVKALTIKSEHNKITIGTGDKDFLHLAHLASGGNR